MLSTDEPLSTDAEPAPHPAAAARQRSEPSPALSRAPLELASAGLTWIHLDAPASRPRTDALAERFGWHALDVEDVLSKRQRPKVDEYPELPLRRPPLPRLRQGDPAPERRRARRLPRARLPRHAAERRAAAGDAALPPLRGGRGAPRASSSRRARAACSTRCSTTSSTTASRSSTRSGTSSTRSRTTMFEERAEEVVRDISNVKQEIISYRKIIKPERATLRLLERHVERFLPEELELYFDDIVDAVRADLGPARQLQGGRRGARGHERVGDLAPPERRPARAHGLQRRSCCR